MPVSDSIKAEIEAMPALLRALLEAELAAGNEIVEVGHSFPAPPIGAFFRLAKPVLTRERKSREGVDYRARNSSLCSGEITDAERRFFLIEPPAGEGSPVSVETTPTCSMGVTSTAFLRFQNSTVIDYEKWHDGVGYDLDALREMSPEERKSTEAMLLQRGVRDWRDIEALASLGTATAERAIKLAANHSDPEVQIAISRYAPGLVSESVQTENLIRLLESATFFAGLGQALDRTAEFHPPPVIEVLLRGTLSRPGEVAVHFAAMLCYVHGQAAEPFDMNQRGFFLRFNTEVPAEREKAFGELCEKIGVDGALYLRNEQCCSMSGPVAVSTDYTVEVDVRGEMLTYCELNRSAHVICTFHPVPCIVTRTLSNWYYPLGRRAEKMSAEEKESVLNRIASYCRKHHRITKLTFE